MSKVGRREFLRQSAKTLGAAAMLATLPASIRRALAADPAVDSGTIQDVKHIVILMQENRSFDHYFGTMRGVRGFGDRIPIPLESGNPVWFQSDGTRELPPFHLNSETSSALLVPGTPHSFSDSQAAWNQGKFGHWAMHKTQISMGYYRREDIPFQFALAEAFTICDAYHCSITSGTDPNRIVFWSGSNFSPALGKLGINCTDKDSEPDNLRCWIQGTMPQPGYVYAGTSFKWPTLPELLQAAGISWRIYQDPNDNWTGAMHGGLAFESFRTATATSGSPLYENGMKHWSLDDLRNDVLNGTLPEVSWILPAQWQSEHPGAKSSPAKAGHFISQVLDAITANDASWSSTVLFLTFDENDGFFDHLPPPAVPSYNSDGTVAGKSTLSLEGEYFLDPARAHLAASDTITGNIRPWGMGPRVPMYVVSPWTKGGWVNSQVFDHTSLGMFLEKRFGIVVENISPWHRAVCGDLTSAFDFSASRSQYPVLPDMSNYADIEAHQRQLPAPAAPAEPDPLFQETGIRFSRALPYELHTSARVESDGTIALLFRNSGAQGAVFHVYDRLNLDRIPRRYTVEGGRELNDSWVADSQGRYDLWVCSANGFLRCFRGDAGARGLQDFRPEVQVCYEPDAGRIHLKVRNAGQAPGIATVRANAYRAYGPWEMNLLPGAICAVHLSIEQSGCWYDFVVTSPGFERRFSGRMETGRAGISDPLMARHLPGNVE